VFNDRAEQYAKVGPYLRKISTGVKPVTNPNCRSMPLVTFDRCAGSCSASVRTTRWFFSSCMHCRLSVLSQEQELSLLHPTHPNSSLPSAPCSCYYHLTQGATEAERLSEVGARRIMGKHRKLRTLDTLNSGCKASCTPSYGLELRACCNCEHRWPGK
jgi:hypothetical protein